MFKVNPYRPGAGLMPTYLAGRDEDIAGIEHLFDALILNIPTQSVIFSGLRGDGKTVLINRLQKLAEDKNIFSKIVFGVKKFYICPNKRTFFRKIS